MRHIKIRSFLTTLLLGSMVLGGCGQAEEKSQNLIVESNQSEDVINIEEAVAVDNADSSSELAVTFGDSGDVFSMYLYEENETAAAIAEYVGSSGWRLPIYEYDDEVNYDVMQYYDIPNSYDIPSNALQITEAKAGEVYYSHPNRVILFYGDAEISGEYTPIGYFDATEEFISAVRDNPTLEGWSNKIIRIDQSIENEN